MTNLRRLEIRALLALAVLCSAVWMVLKLASEVKEGETQGVDRALLLAMRMPGGPHDPRGPRWLQEAARDISALGGFTVLTLVTVASVLLLLIYRRRLQALVFGSTIVLAQIAAEVLKAFVDRPRPDLVSHFDLTYSSSFPSGHSMMSPVVYFTLAVILAAGERRVAARWLVLVGAILLVMAIGVSRVYLGVHWPSDVLAGWTLGSGIALCGGVALHQLAQTKPMVEPPPPQAAGGQESG